MGECDETCLDIEIRDGRGPGSDACGGVGGCRQHLLSHPLVAGDGGAAGDGGQGVRQDQSGRHGDRARRAVRRPADDAALAGGGADGATIAGIYDSGCRSWCATSWWRRRPRRSRPRSRPTGRRASSTAASVGGTLYGIPNEIDVYALNYNKALFEEAGIAGPPKTWDEFMAAAAEADQDRIERPAGLRPDQLVGGRRGAPVRLAARLQWRRAGRRRQAGARQQAGRARRSSSTRS